MPNVLCPGCGRELTVPPEAAGRNIQCPACRQVSRVPKLPAEQKPLSAVAEILAEETEYAQRPKPEQPKYGSHGLPDRGLSAASPFAGRKRKPKKRQRYRAGGAELDPIEWVFAFLCGAIAFIVSIVWMIQGNPKGVKLLLACVIAQVIWTVVGFGIGMVMVIVGSGLPAQ